MCETSLDTRTICNHTGSTTCSWSPTDTWANFSMKTIGDRFKGLSTCKLDLQLQCVWWEERRPWLGAVVICLQPGNVKKQKTMVAPLTGTVLYWNISSQENMQQWDDSLVLNQSSVIHVVVNQQGPKMHFQMVFDVQAMSQWVTVALTRINRLAVMSSNNITDALHPNFRHHWLQDCPV